MRFASRACRGRVAVVKKNWAHHRFSLAKKPLQHSTLAEMEAFLAARGVPFQSERFTLEFGQPLRSEADAVRFFRLYSRDERPEDIAFADIAPRLLRRDDPAFPALSAGAQAARADRVRRGGHPQRNGRAEA